MKIMHVVGARPNFMKIAPIIRAMAALPDDFKQILVHTDQHYDTNMSKVFFDELDIPRPDLHLRVGSDSHARQTARIMLEFEPIVMEQEPDWVVVVGDVNSTLACTLVCSKVQIPVAHVEAGLRSFDRTMPEEVNRIITDSLSDLLFTHSKSADDNLLREGIPAEKIHLVGNVMIDTLIHLLPKAAQRWPDLQQKFALEDFILVTLHRPANVDDAETLHNIMDALNGASQHAPVLFPVHPRTRQKLDEIAWDASSSVKLLEPLSYLDFLSLQQHASVVITDSGGIQEETTYLGIPCLTVRPNTERPVTITEGTNQLVKPSTESLLSAVQAIMGRPTLEPKRVPLWDGQAAHRIAEIMRQAR